MQTIGSAMTTGVTLPVAAAGLATAKVTLDFEHSMNQIRSLVGTNEGQFKKYRTEVLKMARDLPQGPKDLADALYFVTSSGFEANSAMKVLRASAKAAAAGLGETQVVANAVTSAVNAYGEGQLSASYTTDILTATVREGKAEADQLATSIGRVIPIAEQMGVEFEEVGGAIANLTLRGFSSDRAVTGLMAILIDLLKPSQLGQDHLRDLNIEVEDLHKNLGKDFLGTLIDLRKAFDGDTQAMSQLLDNSRGFNAFNALTGRNLEKTKDIMEDVKNSTGDTGKAFEKAAEDPMNKFRKALSNVQVTLIEIGNAVVIPALTKFANWVSDLARKFSALDEPTKNAILSMIGMAAAVGPLLVIIGTLTAAVAAFIANPVLGSMIAGFGILVVLVGKLWLTNEDFRNSVIDVASTIKGVLATAFNIIGKILGPIIDMFGDFKVILIVLVTVISAKLVGALVTLGRTFIAVGAAGALGKFTSALGTAGTALGLLRIGLVSFLGGPVGVAIAVIGGLVAVWQIWNNKQKETTERMKDSYDRTSEWLDQHQEIKDGLSETAYSTKRYKDRLSELKGQLEKVKEGSDEYNSINKKIDRVTGRLNGVEKRHNELLKRRRDLQADILEQNPEYARDLNKQGHFIGTNFKNMDATNRMLRDELVARGKLKGPIADAIGQGKSLQDQYMDTTSTLREWRNGLADANRTILNLGSGADDLARKLPRFKGLLRNVLGMDEGDIRTLLDEWTVDAPNSIKDAMRKLNLGGGFLAPGDARKAEETFEEFFGGFSRGALKAFSATEWQATREAAFDRRRELLSQMADVKGNVDQIGDEVARAVQGVARKGGWRQVFKVWGDQITQGLGHLDDKEGTVKANAIDIVNSLVAGLLENRDVPRKKAQAIGNEVANELGKKNMGQIGAGQIEEFAKGIEKKHNVPKRKVIDIIKETYKEATNWAQRLVNRAGSPMALFSAVPKNLPGAKKGGIAETTAAGIKSGTPSVVQATGNMLQQAGDKGIKTSRTAGTNIAANFHSTLRSRFDSESRSTKTKMETEFDRMLSQQDRFLGQMRGGQNAVRRQFGLSTLGGVQFNARGTDNFQGGLSVVGEEGPEFAVLPRGTSIIPANKTKKYRAQMEALGIPGFARGTGTRRGESRIQGIVELGRMLQRQGYLVGEHPAFGGVAPVHTANSYHYRGMALDINWPGAGEAAKLDQLHRWIQGNVTGVVELLWRVADHYNHLHIAMGPGGAAGFFGIDPKQAVMDATKNIIPPEWKGAMKGIPQKTKKDLVAGLIEQAKGWSAASGAMVGGDYSKGGGAGWIRQAMSITKAPSWWFPLLMQTMSAESGGNPRAYNSTSVGGQHATGLMQTLPSTFHANALPGMQDIYNPVHNAVASIRYRNSRYAGGDWSPYGPISPYARGGISTKENIGRLSERNNREAIIPLDTASGRRALASAMKMAQMEDGSGGGGGRTVNNYDIKVTQANADANDIVREIDWKRRTRGW